MKDMIKAMVQEMVMQSIKEVMTEMMGVNTIAPAEVEKPIKKPTMTKEEFFALEEDAPKSYKDYSNLDFEPVNAKTLKYNGYVPSDIWTVNHLAITQRYGGKWSSKLKGYTFESHSAAVEFAQSYQIKTELTDADYHNIKVYKAERAKAKAEYYAKKAVE